jgi:predicted polyphosphate/ATP-dependent NAD kinase
VRKRRVGLVVNPIAGLGGRVGLKGTDGLDTVRRALELGATPEAPRRAVRALKRLAAAVEDLEVLAFAGSMGSSEADSLGLNVTSIGAPEDLGTTARDTEAAAAAASEAGVDLLLFVGGDGTARNVSDAVGDRVPCLGVPAGVKIQSAVFATTPDAAGDLAGRFLSASSNRIVLREAEVMDIDEDAVREDRVSSKLYGFLRVPYDRGLLQGAKSGSSAADHEAMAGIAVEVIEEMDHDTTFVLGPGTTTRAIAERLGLSKTLLGVDAIRGGRQVGVDLNEGDLLQMIDGFPAKIVVTAIGGQGHIFGRGNQQISPRVIRAVGAENVMVVATRSKLLTLDGRPLLSDTGDEEIDGRFTGYLRVVTGLNERTVYRVASNSA